MVFVIPFVIRPRKVLKVIMTARTKILLILIVIIIMSLVLKNMFIIIVIVVKSL